MSGPVVATVDEDASVTFVRHFDAPRAVLWRAFTDADIVRHWVLGPSGWKMHRCDMDVRVGGEFSWIWRHTVTNAEFGFSGIYHKIEAESRIEDTQTYHQSDADAGQQVVTRNVTTFQDDPMGTRIEARVTYGSMALRNELLEHGMIQGMEVSYQALEDLLQRSREVAAV